MEGIGKRIKIYRKTKGFTVQQFSKIIGISQGSLSDLENEKTKPKGQTLEAIIRYTDIDSQWLMGGQTDMFAQQKTEQATTNERPEAYKVAEPSVEELLQAVREIMASDDVDTKIALARNIVAFRRAVNNDRRIANLEQEIETLKKLLNRDAPPGAVKET